MLWAVEFHPVQIDRPPNTREEIAIAHVVVALHHPIQEISQPTSTLLESVRWVR